VITNIGTAHYELLGSLENIARAKGELLEVLPEGGLAVLNREDSGSLFLGEKLQEKKGRLRYYTMALARDADVRAENLKKSLEGVEFILDLPGSEAGSLIYPYPVNTMCSILWQQPQ
jgi:UDP-N-acetylmuramoyl-tripeptide--D-alanyl-D-alanine ligase